MQDTEVETISFNDNEQPDKKKLKEFFSVFIPQNAFPKELSKLAIRTKIREAMAKHPGDFSQIYWETHEHCTFFIIEFTSKLVYEGYVNKRHPLLNVPIYNWNSANIETYIKRTAEDKAARSIKLVNVPIFYEMDTHQNIINITGKQISNYNSNEQFFSNKYDRELKAIKKPMVIPIHVSP